MLLANEFHISSNSTAKSLKYTKVARRDNKKSGFYETASRFSTLIKP